jgi:hypothetical protein
VQDARVLDAGQEVEPDEGATLIGQQTTIATGAGHDDEIVGLVTERLIESLGGPREPIEQAVRDELARWRSGAALQTFVPLFAGRPATHLVG